MTHTPTEIPLQLHKAPDAHETNKKACTRKDRVTASRARFIASCHATKIPAADVRKFPALGQHSCVGPNI